MAFKTSYVGDGKVFLLAGGGKVFTDMAARFVRGEKSVEQIRDSQYSSQIVRNILDSGHMSATEFDWFVFGVEGYSRVTEAQLVRKRHASYLIKSGRVEHKKFEDYSIVLPDTRLQEFTAPVFLTDGTTINLSGEDLTKIIAQWCQQAGAAGFAAEDIRYYKPQATEFKAIIGMNAHALYDWFAIRCCRNAQLEIRDMAYKMLALCRKVAPDLFANAGPNCVRLGYCPENQRQHAYCKKAGKYLPKDEALKILKKHEKD